MKKMVRGAIAILALSGLSGCVDDPLLDLNTEPTEVRANPIVLNVKQGDSSAVLLRLINPLNNSVPATNSHPADCSRRPDHCVAARPTINSASA